MSNYIPLFVDEITCPCPRISAALFNLVSEVQYVNVGLTNIH